MLQLFTAGEERWELKETSAMHSLQRLISCVKRTTRCGHLNKECLFDMDMSFQGYLSLIDSLMSDFVPALQFAIKNRDNNNNKNSCSAFLSLSCNNQRQCFIKWCM